MSNKYVIHYRHNDIPYEMQSEIPEVNEDDVLRNILNAISNDILRRNCHKGIDGFRELIVSKIIKESDFTD